MTRQLLEDGTRGVGRLVHGHVHARREAGSINGDALQPSLHQHTLAVVQRCGAVSGVLTMQ